MLAFTRVTAVIFMVLAGIAIHIHRWPGGFCAPNPGRSCAAQQTQSPG